MKLPRMRVVAFFVYMIHYHRPMLYMTIGMVYPDWNSDDKGIKKGKGYNREKKGKE